MVAPEHLLFWRNSLNYRIPYANACEQLETNIIKSFWFRFNINTWLIQTDNIQIAPLSRTWPKKTTGRRPHQLAPIASLPKGTVLVRIAMSRIS